SLANAEAELLHIVQVIDHGLVHFLTFLILVFQQLRSRTRVAGEKDSQVIFKRIERRRIKLCGASAHPSVGADVEAGYATICRDELILLADRLFQQIYFNLASFLGEVIRSDQQVFLIGVQRLEESRSEGAGRAESGAGWNISHTGDFQIRADFESFK